MPISASTFSNRAHARAVRRRSPKPCWALTSSPRSRHELARSLRHELLALTPDQPDPYGENEKVLGNGEVRWFAWTNHALFDQPGKRTRLPECRARHHGARRAEQALRESEARFFGAAESIPDGLMILDPEDQIVFYNERHRRALAHRSA